MPKKKAALVIPSLNIAGIESDNIASDEMLKTKFNQDIVTIEEINETLSKKIESINITEIYKSRADNPMVSTRTRRTVDKTKGNIRSRRTRLRETIDLNPNISIEMKDPTTNEIKTTTLKEEYKEEIKSDIKTSEAINMLSEGSISNDIQEEEKIKDLIDNDLVRSITESLSSLVDFDEVKKEFDDMLKEEESKDKTVILDMDRELNVTKFTHPADEISEDLDKVSADSLKPPLIASMEEAIKKSIQDEIEKVGGKQRKRGGRKAKNKKNDDKNHQNRPRREKNNIDERSDVEDDLDKAAEINKERIIREKTSETNRFIKNTNEMDFAEEKPQTLDRIFKNEGDVISNKFKDIRFANCFMILKMTPFIYNNILKTNIGLLNRYFGNGEKICTICIQNNLTLFTVTCTPVKVMSGSLIASSDAPYRFQSTTRVYGLFEGKIGKKSWGFNCDAFLKAIKKVHDDFAKILIKIHDDYRMTITTNQSPDISSLEDPFVTIHPNNGETRLLADIYDNYGVIYIFPTGNLMNFMSEHLSKWMKHYDDNIQVKPDKKSKDKDFGAEFEEHRENLKIHITRNSDLNNIFCMYGEYPPLNQSGMLSARVAPHPKYIHSKNYLPTMQNPVSFYIDGTMLMHCGIKAMKSAKHSSNVLLCTKRDGSPFIDIHFEHNKDQNKSSTTYRFECKNIIMATNSL